MPEISENSTGQPVRKKRESRSKDELAYWKSRIRRVPDSPYWYAEIQRGKIRRKISLETSNKAAAAHRARELWDFVRTHGWEAYMARYKPQIQKNADPTIGEFIAAVEATADLTPMTLANYIGSLRKIVADISGLSDDRHRYGGPGRDAWLVKVHAVPLSTLTSLSFPCCRRSAQTKVRG
jgi:hypothetical protein